MKRKLRLIMTTKCNRNCSGCCNKQFDIDNLPLEDDFTGYDQIFITGGEPMIEPFLLLLLISVIREQNPKAEIYVYTANLENPEFAITILKHTEGLTITLHEQRDVQPLKNFQTYAGNLLNKRSVRLNVFKEVSINPDCFTEFEIKQDIVWLEDCPLPEGEVLKRVDRSVYVQEGDTI